MTAINFGNKLKELLNQRGHSIRECSKETGIDKSTISRIINGKRKANIQHLNKLAPYLETPLIDLLAIAGYSQDSIANSDLYTSIETIQQTLTEDNFYEDNFSSENIPKKTKAV